MVCCSAFGCGNSTNKKKGIEKDKKSFFVFPDKIKDQARHNAWVNRISRANWEPSRHARLCEDHFDDTSFTRNPHVVSSVGFAVGDRRYLKPDAVPTIFVRKNHISHPTRKRRKSGAVMKRQNLELIAKSETKQMDGSPSPNVESLMEVTEVTEVTDDDHLFEAAKEVGIQTEMKMPELPKSTQTYMCTISRGVQAYPWHCSTTMTTTFTQTDSPEEVFFCDVGCGTSDFPQCEDKGNFIEDEDEDEDDEYVDVENDPDWVIPEDLDLSDDDYMSDEAEFDECDNLPNSNNRIFLVFENCLRILLSVCMMCKSTCKVTYRMIGTMAIYDQQCKCGYKNRWESQPRHGSMPMGNLLIATGIFGSGASATKAMNALEKVGVAMFSMRTYLNLQVSYIIPAVQNVWRKEQESLVSLLKQKDNLNFAGDGRCCTPGHTAKYGSYSLMETTTNKVVDVQLVQSNEVTSSQAMELEGLKRCLQYLSSKDVKCSGLITDRHGSIKKFLREQKPEIKHWFDVWHVAKGIYKKIEAKSKKKGFEVLHDWSHSISNHVYWCASSSKGDGEILRAKWSSIGNHVANIHEGHSEHYPQCDHDPMVRKWIKKDSRVHKDLLSVLNMKLLVNDIGKLSPRDQTSSLEAYHKVVCFFAPKSLHYFFASMQARILLAAIHTNHNAGRKQLLTKTGEKMFAVSYPKWKKGGSTVKPVKKVSFGYMQDLIAEVKILRDRYPSYREAAILRTAVRAGNPPPIAEKYVHRPKEELVAGHKSRFAKKL